MIKITIDPTYDGPATHEGVYITTTFDRPSVATWTIWLPVETIQQVAKTLLDVHTGRQTERKVIES